MESNLIAEHQSSLSSAQRVSDGRWSLQRVDSVSQEKLPTLRPSFGHETEHLLVVGVLMTSPRRCRKNLEKCKASV